MFHYYHAKSGTTAARLPRAWDYGGEVTMGITEANMADFDWAKIETPDAPPAEPVISDALAAKERTFAAMLLHYATAFSVDLTALPDINISAMLQAAQAAGATDAEIADATAMLLAAKADIEAEAGGSWAECWAGLKGRLPGYLQELSTPA